jgi:hypothetical protein
LIEGNPVDVVEKDKRGNFIQSVRLGVNDFGDRNGVSDQAEEIDFFAAERGIVLIDAKHHEFRCRVELDSEIRVAKPMSEWLYVKCAATREDGLDDLL